MERAKDAVLGQTVEATAASRTAVYECPWCRTLLYLRTGQRVRSYFAHPPNVNPDCPLRNLEGRMNTMETSPLRRWLSQRGDRIVAAFRSERKVFDNVPIGSSSLLDSLAIKVLSFSSVWRLNGAGISRRKPTTMNLLRLLQRPEAYAILQRLISIVVKSGNYRTQKLGGYELAMEIAQTAERIDWARELTPRGNGCFPEALLANWPLAQDVEYDRRLRQAVDKKSRIVSSVFEHTDDVRLYSSCPLDEVLLINVTTLMLEKTGVEVRQLKRQRTTVWINLSPNDTAIVKSSSDADVAYLYILPNNPLGNNIVLPHVEATVFAESRSSETRLHSSKEPNPQSVLSNPSLLDLQSPKISPEKEPNQILPSVKRTPIDRIESNGEVHCGCGRSIHLPNFPPNCSARDVLEILKHNGYVVAESCVKIGRTYKRSQLRSVFVELSSVHAARVASQQLRGVMVGEWRLWPSLRVECIRHSQDRKASSQGASRA